MEEQRKDQLSNEEVLGREFDLDDSLFQTETKAKVKKTRVVKRKDRLMAFSKADKEKPDEEETGPVQLAEEQKADETLQQAWEATEEKGSEFECKNDLLYHRTGKQEEELQLAVPTTQRKKLIRLAHTDPMAAHIGQKRTSEKLFRRYWWPVLCQDVKRFIQECVECQRAVPMRKSKAPLRMMPVFSTPFNRLAADIVGPLPLSERKNRYILTIMDCSTRNPEAVPPRRVDVASVADALLQFFCWFKLPKELLRDRGSNFTSTLMEETLERLGVKHVKSSPYHQETNGMIERWHGTLKTMLRKAGKGKKEWDLLLPVLLFAYRDAVHESTGFSPFELTFAWHVRGPLDAVREQWEGMEKFPVAVADYLTTLYERMVEISEIAEKKDLEVKEKTKKWFDRNTIGRRFEVGESVLVLIPERKSKLEVVYSGPYTVMEQVSPVTYKLDLRGQHGLGLVVHINLMKKWNTPTAQVLSVTLLTDEEEPDQGEIIMIEPGGDEAPVLDDSLNAEQRQEVSALLQEFATVFSHLPGKTELTFHEIRTAGATPIRMPPYRITMAYQKQDRE